MVMILSFVELIEANELKMSVMDLMELNWIENTPNKCGSNNTLPVNLLTRIKEACIEDKEILSFQKRKTRGFL